MDFQKYNIKEKKQKEKGRKKKTNKQELLKKNKPPTTIQRLYMVFAFKKKSPIIIGYRNRN